MSTNSEMQPHETLPHRLTDLAYWQSVHETHPLSERFAPNVARKTGLVARLARALAGRTDFSESYPDFHFWNVLNRLLPKSDTARILELGAAPGNILIEFKNRFGYIPYGVEYTHPGANQVRAAFTAAGVPEENVFECDAFTESFQSKYAGRFDIVTSLGLIEHFHDVEQIIRCHVNLLAPGGTLVIRVPRLRGLNYLLAKAIDPDSLKIHNLSIMSQNRFRQLFRLPAMNPLYCGYQGGAHFLIADTPRRGTLSKIVLGIAKPIQVLATILLFRCYSGGDPFESALLSPHLLYVGTKSAPARPIEAGAKR